MAVSILIMVFAVFSMSVTAQELQNQTKDQQTSQILNNLNSAQTNLAQQSSTANSSNSSTTESNNQVTNPVANSTNSTVVGPITNETSNNSTQTNSTEPTNQTNTNSTSTNTTNPTIDLSTVLQGVFGQLFAPVISDANALRANPTTQSIDQLLNDVNSALNQIEQLEINVNINV